jgi:hypothetical protein
MNNYSSPNEGHGDAVAEHAQVCGPAPKWAVLVDDEPIPMPRQVIKADVIKAQAEIPPGFALVRDYDSPDDTVTALNGLRTGRNTRSIRQ